MTAMPHLDATAESVVVVVAVRGEVVDCCILAKTSIAGLAIMRPSVVSPATFMNPLRLVCIWLTPFRVDVTVPAVGYGRHVIVASVTKFRLGRVTVQTGFSQALGILLTIAVSISPEIIANNFFPPIEQHVHMIGSHVLG